jgi:hypothetical protein
MWCIRWWSIGLVSVVLAWTGVAVAQTPYQFQDLGAFLPVGMNSHGTMVGSVLTPAQIAARLLHPNGTPDELGLLGVAQALHSSGVAVGYAVQGPEGQEAMAWDLQGIPYPLGFLPDGLSSQATSINLGGQVCGYGQDHTGVWRALLVVPSHEPPRASLVSQRLGLLVGNATAVRAPRGVAPRGAHRGRAGGRLVAAACRCCPAGPGATAGVPGETCALDATAMVLCAAAPADLEALCAGYGVDAVIAETRMLFLARWHAG